MWLPNERVGRVRRLAAWSILCLGLGLASSQEPASASYQDLAPPKRVFPDSSVSVDPLLSRPYGPDVPFGPVGARLWASSPQSWGFPSDVHWLYLTGLGPIDLELRDEVGPLIPLQATYFPSHVHLDGAVRLDTASASSTGKGTHVQNPLTRPFSAAKRWSSTVAGASTDWYQVDFGAERTLKGLKLWFLNEAGSVPPRQYQIQIPDGDGWKPVRSTGITPDAPSAGENTILFNPVTTSKLRVLLSHADTSHSTSLYGFLPVDTQPEDAQSGPGAIGLSVSGDKFLSADDGLYVVLRVTNNTASPRVIEVVPAIDWEGQFEGRLIGNRPASGSQEPFGPWVVEAEGQNRFHGFDVVERLRYTVSCDPPHPLDVTESRRFTMAVARGAADNAGYLRKSMGFRYTLGPSETWVFRAAAEIKQPGEKSGLDSLLNAASTFTRNLEAKSHLLGTLSAERQDNRDLLAVQVASTQKWFDSNLAAFDCSDPLVRKMYYHRAHVLRKNMMDPALGALKWPTQSEGRWRSSWYPNIISYGAAHQIREARWLADPRYWSGHLQTWANNPKSDGVFPSHVTPAGPAGGQYTDWITSTAWDGHRVHPDRALLEKIVEPLASNVKGWQATRDPDGNGLLSVDSHWWTGMEYQPSFFSFGDYQTSADRQQPATPVELERVDLTAYNYGNARAVARIYAFLGQDDKAREFDELADRIRKAVSEQMWDRDDSYFYSLRADDHTPARIKEIVGVYPFYFNMFPPEAGYATAWEAILDPEQFWTPWPVASVSRKNPAYSQTGWPAADNQRIAACMWNGPTWPHANSIVLSAMAATLRADATLGEAAKDHGSPLSRDKLWELFTSFTKAQFRNQDESFPWTGEYYNGETGEWKTAERDYNHSTWLDILIPDLLGLVPRADEILEIDPLLPPTALAHATLDGQRYHGHDVTIVWDAPGDNQDTHSDGREGLDVYLDGKLAASSPELKRLLIDMKTGKPVEGKAPEPAGTRSGEPRKKP